MARGELIGVESLEAKEPFEAVVAGPREAVVFTASAEPTKRKWPSNRSADCGEK